MTAFILTIAIGIVLIVIGITNTKGNISTLHSYHRNRVQPEDVLPFGKQVGLGTIICGIAVIIMGGFSILADALNKEIFAIIGTVILIIGLIIGLVITFRAMIKYNRGIF